MATTLNLPALALAAIGGAGTLVGRLLLSGYRGFNRGEVDTELIFDARAAKLQCAFNLRRRRTAQSLDSQATAT